MKINLKTIAQLSGVSIATVSRVVNNKGNVKEETEQKVKDAVSLYNYVPNAAAKSLKSDDTKTLALIVPDITNYFFTEVLAGFEEACTEEGYTVILSNTSSDVEKEEQAIKLCLTNRVSGVLAAFADTENKYIDYLKDYNIPLVCLDRKPVDRMDVDSFLTDNDKAMDDMVDYLVKLNHRKIAMILGVEEITPGYERNHAFINAMNKRGLTIPEDYLQQGEFTVGGSYNATEKLLRLKDRPTAIITSSNYSTMGTYMALVDNGIKIGEEISLLGFDDFPLAAYLTPPITVMRKPNIELGVKAARVLMEHINSENKYAEGNIYRLPMSMIERESCRRIS